MLALGTLPPERVKNASGLFNLMRNLGGAVGLAVINTVLNKRWDLHLERLREAVDLEPRGGQRAARRHDAEPLLDARLGCRRRRAEDARRHGPPARRW